MVLISLLSSVPWPTGKCKDGRAALSVAPKPVSWDARACIHSAPTTVIPSLFRAPYFRLRVRVQLSLERRHALWNNMELREFYIFDLCHKCGETSTETQEGSLWVFTEDRAISYSCQASVYWCTHPSMGSASPSSSPREYSVRCFSYTQSGLGIILPLPFGSWVI